MRDAYICNCSNLSTTLNNLYLPMDLKKTIRAIIAEDDFLVCDEIERQLTQIGCQVIAKTSNGEEAVELVCSLKPDVVLMDITMPKLDGLEASQQINKRHPTPVIVLTAHDSQEMISKASKNGVAAYLTKPPDPRKLEQAIMIAIARHEDFMELKRLNHELQKALDEIETLRGIIPICAKCKKIRDDKECWNNLESYIESRSEAVFSHGICPDCADELYGDAEWYKKRKKKGIL
jgi:two-component system, response regulator PdtaR